ncbi:tRNA dimethylallyltransferase [Candidatus Microgenomates bacterium]|nr:tRNA dimethylallyltransferase [Candidatus Microgenomates bacterium]
MEKIVVICGPTAVGKTKLGVQMAQKFCGEIVSCDSRQIYCGMDIGTGKDLPQDAKTKIGKEKLKIKISASQAIKPYRFNEVPVWLLDVVNPDQSFTAADYYDLSWKVIRDIWCRGRLPFLLGGTGFYIKALLEDIKSLGIPPDWKLRKKLSELGIDELGEILSKAWTTRWQAMNESDRKNPRRLIRAIEIAEKMRKPQVKEKSQETNFEVLMIGLKAPFKILYQFIDERVEERIKMGAEEEVRKLIGKGYSWNLVSMSGHGYFEWRPYFEGRQNLSETISRWKYDEHSYARRQMTWFKKNKQIKWFDITQPDFDKKIEIMIESFCAAQN